MTKESFAREVLAAEKSLYYVAKSILPDDEDCADAIQNAILSAFGRLDTLKQECYFKTWLTRILINECYTLLRKKRDVISYEDYLEAVPAEEKAEYPELWQEIAELPGKYRVPVVLHYVEGYSTKEIAGMLKTSEGSVRTRLYRGRMRLRERLKGVAGYEAY